MKVLKNKTTLALIAVLIVLIGLIAFFSLKLVNMKTIYAVDVSTYSERSIKDWYYDEFGSLDTLNIKYEYSETIPKGSVISQSIKEGEEITDEFKVIISNGADPFKEIELPDFTDYTKEQIEKFFNENYFSDVSFEYEKSDLPVDTVIRVNVSEKAKRSDLIMITLSAGDDIEKLDITVPNFLKYTVNNAKAWGNSYGITIKVSYVFSDKHPAGNIISQSVAEGTTVVPNESITLQVSMGKGVMIKDLKALSLNDAKKWCDENNLKYDINYEYSDTVKKDYVISQSPKSGLMEAEGNTVKLTVSKGVNPDNIEIDVANYENKTESEFLSYIKNLGMTANKTNSYYSSYASGNIISNDNGKIKKSVPVNYTLSLGEYKLTVDNFNGKTKSQADSIIKDANDKKAGVSLTISGSEYSDAYAKDVLFGCSVSGKTITCKQSLGSMKTVGNYVGRKIEKDFTEDEITYKIVMDDFYTDGSNPYDVYEQSVAAGTKVEKGTTVILKVRKGTKPEEPKAVILSSYSAYEGQSISETESILNNTLGMFQLTIEQEYDNNLTAGKIVKIYVNDNASYSEGSYPVSTRVRVIISKGYPE